MDSFELANLVLFAIAVVLHLNAPAKQAVTEQQQQICQQEITPAASSVPETQKKKQK